MKLKQIFVKLVCFLYLVKSQFAQINNISFVETRNVSVCKTEICQQLADDLVASIDLTVDPCDNFYLFACGTWKKNNEIPDYYSDYGANSVVEENVNANIEELLETTNSEDLTSRALKYMQFYFESCKDIETINNTNGTELINILRSNERGWPILKGNSSLYSSSDVTNVIGSLISKYGGDYFVEFSTSPDIMNTSFNRFNVDQMTLGLGEESRDYYLNNTLYSDIMIAYKRLILNFIKIIDKNIDENSVNSQIDEMLTLEHRLANISIPEEKMRNQTKTYNLWSVESLRDAVPYIKWSELFRTILPKDVLEIFIKEDFLLVVYEPEYLHGLQNVLHTTNPRTLINYVYWRFILDRNDYLDNRFADAYQEFSKKFLGQKSRMDRDSECIALTVSTFPIATGALFVRNNLKSTTKREAVKLTNQLKLALRRMIVDLDWMDNSTKHYAIQKLDAMKENVGYADYVFNDTLLDEEYENLTIHSDDSFFKINNQITLWKQMKSYYELLNPVERERFDSSAAEVDAYNFRDKNLLRIPAGILQYPFFDTELPRYVNYGNLGTIIGHEITHGFDDEGAQYYKYGNLYNWWSENSFQQFMEKIQCLINKYNTYVLENVTDHHVNGEKTSSENIADLGGVRVAFNAYQNYIRQLGRQEKRLPGLKQFTNNQMFFINFAYFYCENRNVESSLQQILSDDHSPHEFRVNGVLENSVEFSTTFNCANGSKMNPSNPKCFIW